MPGPPCRIQRVPGPPLVHAQPSLQNQVCSWYSDKKKKKKDIEKKASKSEAYRTLSNAVDLKIKIQLSWCISHASPSATSTADYAATFQAICGQSGRRHRNYISSMAPGSTREAYIQKINWEKKANGMGQEHHVRFTDGFYMKNADELVKGMFKVLYRQT